MYRVLLGKVQTQGRQMAFNSLRVLREATKGKAVRPDQVIDNSLYYQELDNYMSSSVRVKQLIKLTICN